jgi:predicted transcriptional regulator YdeE
MESVAPFNIVGIAITTSNQDNRTMKDIGELWARFFDEQVFKHIPYKEEENIYMVYTDYTSDYTGSYTALLGAKVASLDYVPANMTGKSFNGGVFIKFVAKGDMPKALIETWQKIWTLNDSLGRTYTYDFEVYTENAHNEIEVFVAV